LNANKPPTLQLLYCNHLSLNTAGKLTSGLQYQV